MKADFEKGTKVCSKCKKELPISEFHKCKSRNDGLSCTCKKCVSNYNKKYNKINNGARNTFGRVFGKRGRKRGNSGMVLRDYELTKEQLEKRNKKRKEQKGYHTRWETPQGLLVWYDEMLNNYSDDEYRKIINREYSRQRSCAIRGYVARVKPSEHFLFDFDLEQMLKDNVYYGRGEQRVYITKWWDGEIRHWTVNDGIWRK